MNSTSQATAINTTVQGTYTRIESDTVLQSIDTALTSRGIDYTRRLQHRVGTKSTKHCIVYTLHSLEALKINGDSITPQIYVFNSYAKESAFLISVGFLRWVCGNGLVLGEDLFTSRIIHRTGPTIQQKVSEIEYGVAAALDFIQSGEMQGLVSDLTSLELTTEQGISVIGSLPVPKRAREDAIAVWTNSRQRRVEDGGDHPVDTYGIEELSAGQTGGSVWHLWNIINECMRLRARSIVANLEKNRDLLDHILALVEYETLESATTVSEVA